MKEENEVCAYLEGGECSGVWLQTASGTDGVWGGFSDKRMGANERFSYMDNWVGLSKLRDAAPSASESGTAARTA